METQPIKRAKGRRQLSQVEMVRYPIEQIFGLIGKRQFSRRRAHEIVLSIHTPDPIVEDLLRFLPKIAALYHNKKSWQAFQLLRSAVRQATLADNFALAVAGGPAAAAGIGKIIIFILDLIAKLITIILGVRELVQAVSASPDTERWEQFQGSSTFDTRNVEIIAVVCNSTIKDVEDGITIIIRKINRGCKLTILGNDGTIYIGDNQGEVEIKDNDDTIVVDQNNGQVMVDGNDDTVAVNSNNAGGTVTVNGNSDAVGVNTNSGTVDINGNDDAVTVGSNNGTVTVDNNNDTVNVGDNNGTINVNGNAGGNLDDADVNVADNQQGIINANNNDGNINVSFSNGSPQGTINKGGKPGDIQRLN